MNDYKKLTSKMLPAHSPDSQKISLKVIEAIKEHPVLYVSEVKGNALRLQEFRQKVWKRISDELGLDPIWVKLKWKNLRDTYCRILKYKNKSPKGVKRKKWIFEDHLSFLKFPYEPDYESQCVELTDEYINDINTEIINSQDIMNQLEYNEENDDYSEYLEIHEEDTNMEESPSLELSSNNETLQKLAIDAHAKQIQLKFRKIRPKKTKQLKHEENLKSVSPKIVNSSPIVPEQILSLQNPAKVKKLMPQKNSFDYKADVDNFFSSISRVVKKLPPKAQADIKMEIHKIVAEAEAENSNKKNSTNMLRFSSTPGMMPKLILVPCKLIDNQNNRNT